MYEIKPKRWPVLIDDQTDSEMVSVATPTPRSPLVLGASKDEKNGIRLRRLARLIARSTLLLQALKDSNAAFRMGSPWCHPGHCKSCDQERLCRIRINEDLIHEIEVDPSIQLSNPEST